MKLELKFKPVSFVYVTHYATEETRMMTYAEYIGMRSTGMLWEWFPNAPLEWPCNKVRIEREMSTKIGDLVRVCFDANKEFPKSEAELSKQILTVSDVFPATKSIGVKSISGLGYCCKSWVRITR
jgi:hypothetical protein